MGRLFAMNVLAEVAGRCLLSSDVLRLGVEDKEEEL